MAKLLVLFLGVLTLHSAITKCTKFLTQTQKHELEKQKKKKTKNQGSPGHQVILFFRSPNRNPSFLNCQLPGRWSPQPRPPPRSPSGSGPSHGRHRLAREANVVLDWLEPKAQKKMGHVWKTFPYQKFFKRSII